MRATLWNQAFVYRSLLKPRPTQRYQSPGAQVDVANLGTHNELKGLSTLYGEQDRTTHAEGEAVDIKLDSGSNVKPPG